ncbi:MAG: hypothetical protein V6Z81_09720 [Parvularculales bacterium]
MKKLLTICAISMALAGCARERSPAHLIKPYQVPEKPAVSAMDKGKLAVQQGMSQAEVSELFGPPQSVSVKTCRQESDSSAARGPGGTPLIVGVWISGEGSSDEKMRDDATVDEWPCTVWEYDKYNIKGSFYFTKNDHDGKWRLDTFGVTEK